MLLYCKVTVHDGVASARYHWEDLPVPGSISHDEDVSDWTDEEIADCIADLVGIEEGEKDKIEVVRQ